MINDQLINYCTDQNSPERPRCRSVATKARTEAEATTKFQATAATNTGTAESQKLVAELETCRQTLRTTFEMASNQYFVYVCCAVSCIMHARDPLQPEAITTAVTGLVEYHVAIQRHVKPGIPTETQWLTFCQFILRINTNGTISFKSMAMRLFLSSFRIRGLDASQKTIALACLIRLNLDHRETSAASDTFEEQIDTVPTRTFSTYAAQHVNYHCRWAGITNEYSNNRDLTTLRIAYSRIGPQVAVQEYRSGAATLSEPMSVISDQLDRVSLDDDWIVV